ncbi:MAG: hypothetical protein AAGB11_17830 [Pseudomonadota bacterium]
MTAIALPRSAHRRLSLDPRFSAAAVILSVLAVLLIWPLMADPRSFGGHSIWLKPQKFAVSLAVYTATLALFAHWLPERLKVSKLFAAYVWVVLSAIGLEMIWLIAAAALGVASHFNEVPPWNTFYSMAGVLAVILTSAAAVFGIAILLGRHMDPALRLGLGLGLILTFVLTVITAGYMGGNGSHHVGIAGPDDPSWPVFGWSLTVGDLRPAHFLATHAMQAVPAAALLVVVAGIRRPRAWVAAASVLYTAATVGAFVEALAGKPFLSTAIG